MLDFGRKYVRIGVMKKLITYVSMGLVAMFFIVACGCGNKKASMTDDYVGKVIGHVDDGYRVSSNVSVISIDGQEYIVIRSPDGVAICKK